MSKFERITVTVPADMAAVLRDSVDDGEYATTSEIVREALREWSRQREREQSERHLLRQLVAEGDASGPGVAASEVFAELRQLLADRRARGE
jgi:antitoxin ParD1/3/4